MSRERMMLVEAFPRLPTAPVLATWDPIEKGPGIVLSNGNLTATKSVIHATDWDGVVATVMFNAGRWYWETTYTFTGSANIAAGMTRGSFSVPLGSNSPVVPFSISGPYRNGRCYAGMGAPPTGTGHWATTATPTSGVVVRHWYDADSSIYRVAVANGPWFVAEQGTTNVDPATVRVPFWPSVSLLRVTSSTVSCTANFGQSPFVYPVPAGANPGVYLSQAPTVVPVYLSSHPFGTQSTDIPASTGYEARIVADQDVEVTREVGCWVWGNSTQAKAGQVVVTNVDGGLDVWSDYDWRDAEIRIYTGFRGDPRSAFTLWTGSRVEDIRFDDRRINIVLADALAPLQVPIQREVFPEDHPIEAEIGNPIPITFGLPFYVTGTRMSPAKLGADAYAWQVHDGLNPLLTSKGTIFDNGIDITAACVTWPAVAPIKGFRVSGTAPKGKVTCHPAGNGSTTVLTIVQQAVARLPAGTIPPPTIAQPVPVTGIGSWAAMYIRQPRTILEVIREAMDSVCGWAVPSRAGTQLRLGRVREPYGLPSALQLDRSNVIGTPVIELDTAPGLTTRIAGRRNWSPHQFSEIAASITDPASGTYNPNLTANLQAEFMAIRTGSPQVVNESMVSAAYAQARQANAKGTILQESTHIKAEANRVCTLWFPTRHFIYLKAILSAADVLEPGDIVSLYWPRYGLNAASPARGGNTFLVISVRSRFWSSIVDLKLWGSMPITQFGAKGG